MGAESILLGISFGILLRELSDLLLIERGVGAEHEVFAIEEGREGGRIPRQEGQSVFDQLQVLHHLGSQQT